MAQPSIFRGGNSLIYVAPAAEVSLLVNNQSVEFDVQERGSLRRLVIPTTVDTVTIENTYIGSFKSRGLEMISGLVPATLFGQDCLQNPAIDIPIDPVTKPIIQARDTTFNGKFLPTLQCGAAGGRLWAPIIAVGPAAEKAMVATVEQTWDITINRGVLLGQLHFNKVIDDLGAKDIRVLAIVVDGDNLMNGAAGISARTVNNGTFHQPWLGTPVARGAVIRVTALCGAALANVCPCFSTINPNEPWVTDETRAWLAEHQ